LTRDTAAARTLTHARIQLEAHELLGGPRWTDDAIAEALDVNRSKVERVRVRCVENGVDARIAAAAIAPTSLPELDGLLGARASLGALAPFRGGRLFPRCSFTRRSAASATPYLGFLHRL